MKLTLDPLERRLLSNYLAHRARVNEAADLPELARTFTEAALLVREPSGELTLDRTRNNQQWEKDKETNTTRSPR